MFTITTLITITYLISIILMILSSILSKKSLKDREKSSPFECGFDPYKTARLPFLLRFFMIAIIFLMFDVEITLLMPIPILFSFLNMTLTFYMSMLFITLLLLGLYYEWKMGALDWTS